MAKQNSSKWKLLISTVAIDNLSDLSFEVNNKLIDVTTKDSAGWEEFLPGLKGASFSGSGIVDFLDGGVTPDDIFTALAAGTLVTGECSDAVSGSIKYTFTGYYDKYSIDGGTEDAIKFSFSGKVTGAVTQGTVA